MISHESDEAPTAFQFDIAIVAVGFEQRCKWVTDTKNIQAGVSLGLEFGFLTEGSYASNFEFFSARGFQIINGLGPNAVKDISANLLRGVGSSSSVTIFLDISAMSREMIANVILSLKTLSPGKDLSVTVAYAPSEFSGPYRPAPIRLASPIKPVLAGWTTSPELPVGALFGLGCEPGLALGALQFLEPNKAWVFSPVGIDPRFDKALVSANEHVEDIFDVTRFDYDIKTPSVARAKIEVLLNAVEHDFRLVIVPFGPKIFAWLALSTVVFSSRTSVGVWAFSSKEHAQLIDRAADGPIIWHTIVLSN